MENIIIISGIVASDIEASVTAGKGTAVAKFSLAEHGYDYGKKEEKTQFHRLTAFGKTAERLAKCAKKGIKMTVKGHLDINTVEKDGKKVTYYNVTVEDFDVFLPKKEGESTAD